MQTRGILTKVLAIAGTMLVWFPLLAPVFFSAASLVLDRVFRFDYLMPAELGLVALAGAGLLLWAALRARSRRGLIGLSLAVAVGLVVGGQALATVTGLASGRIPAQGVWFALVVASLVGYTLALVAMGIGGVLLSRDVLR